MRRALLRILLVLPALLLLEATGRLVFSWEPLFDRVAGDNDPSWEHRWVLGQRNAPAAVEAFDPYNQYDPELGWVPRANLRNALTREGWRVSTNSAGLRGPEEHAALPATGRPRLLVIGDSFTFGEEVNDADTWCAQLQKLLPGVEVVNMGVGGYGHDQMLLYLRRNRGAYHPDLVILGFVDYDVGRNTLDFRSFAKPRFVLRDAGLERVRPHLPTPQEVLVRRPARLRSLDLLEMAWQPVARSFRAAPLLRAITDQILATTRDMGAELVLIDLPTGKHVEARGWKQLFTVDYCASRGLRCVALRPWVQGEVAAGETFRTGLRHWDEAGHALVARGVAEALQRQGILDCKTEGSVQTCKIG